MKQLFFDTECSGTKAEYHEILQISGVYYQEGVQEDEFNLFCRPCYPERIEEEALRVQGRSKEEVLAYPNPKESFARLVCFFDKHVDKFNTTDKINVYAFNSSFDSDFLYHFFDLYSPPSGNPKFPKKYYVGNYMYKQAICVLQAYRFSVDLGLFPMPKDFKLGTLCEIHGIVLKAHDALEDAKATKSLYEIIRNKHGNHIH